MAVGLIHYFIIVEKPLPFGSDFIGDFGDSDFGEIAKDVHKYLFAYLIPRWETLGFTVVFQKGIVCVLTHDIAKP